MSSLFEALRSTSIALEYRRLSSAAGAATVGLFLLATSCTSSTSEAGDDGPPPPTPESLFDTLAAPTPDKLRGVWQNTQTQTNGTIEIRLRFIERHLVGAAKCSATNGPTVIAGGSIGLDTSALDAATGKITIGTLGLLKEENGLRCEASLPGNTYDFTIADGTLSFTAGDARLNETFKKIGD